MRRLDSAASERARAPPLGTQRARRVALGAISIDLDGASHLGRVLALPEDGGAVVARGDEASVVDLPHRLHLRGTRRAPRGVERGCEEA